MKTVDYREILRLEALGYSRARVAASVHSSHHTVKAVLDAAMEKGVAWPLESEVGNAELGQILFPDKCRELCGAELCRHPQGTGQARRDHDAAVGGIPCQVL